MLPCALRATLKDMLCLWGIEGHRRPHVSAGLCRAGQRRPARPCPVPRSSSRVAAEAVDSSRAHSLGVGSIEPPHTPARSAHSEHKGRLHKRASAPNSGAPPKPGPPGPPRRPPAPGPRHSPLDVGVIVLQEVIVISPVLKNVLDETAWETHGQSARS